MTPQDFPAAPLRHLDQDLAERCRDSHELAQRAPGPAMQIGHYEAALAYAQAARMAHQAFLEVMAALEPDPAEQHPWPIEGLDNYGGLHDAHSLLDHAKRFPAWGIDAGSGKSTFVTVAKSAHPGEVILRISTGRADRAQSAPDREASAGFPIEQWRALNQLVERIAAGLPVPYNTAGDLPPTGDPLT